MQETKEKIEPEKNYSMEIKVSRPVEIEVSVKANKEDVVISAIIAILDSINNKKGNAK